jgi:hypothetical protein
MGLIRVMKTDNTTGQVDVEVSTSTFHFTFPVKIDDQGSAGNNERQAFLELQTFLTEALELVRHQLG